MSDKPFVVHVIKRFAILIDLSVYLFNFILVLGESEVDIPSEIFDFDGSGIQRYFDTIILHFRQVYSLGGISERAWDRLGDKQVGSLGIIVFYRTIDSSVEESEIKSDISGSGRFPFQVRVGQFRSG